MSIEMIEVEAFNSGTQIKVIGVGGGGGNAVEHMISSGVQGVEFVCANTDAQALRVSNAHKVIQLGSTGLGAGSKPERGREAAEAAIDDIRLALEGTNMLFVTAGMGGGTGTGAGRAWREARLQRHLARRDRRGDRLAGAGRVLHGAARCARRRETPPGRPPAATDGRRRRHRTAVAPAWRGRGA